MNLVCALLVFVASLVAFSSIGIVSATFAVVFKRGDPLVWLFGGLSWLLSGVFYPRDVLPHWLQQAAQLLPLTHALEAMRAALIGGATIPEVLPQMKALALFGVVGLPLSVLAFHSGVGHAKAKGTLGHS